MTDIRPLSSMMLRFFRQRQQSFHRRLFRIKKYVQKNPWKRRQRPKDKLRCPSAQRRERGGACVNPDPSRGLWFDDPKDSRGALPLCLVSSARPP